MKITLEVKNCYDCHWSTNSSKEHDCAFTSAPYPTRWWCTNPINDRGSYHLSIKNENITHPDCRLNKPKEMWEKEPDTKTSNFNMKKARALLKQMEGWAIPPPVEELLTRIVDYIESQEVIKEGNK